MSVSDERNVQLGQSDGVPAMPAQYVYAGAKVAVKDGVTLGKIVSRLSMGSSTPTAAQLNANAENVPVMRLLTPHSGSDPALASAKAIVKVGTANAVTVDLVADTTSPTGQQAYLLALSSDSFPALGARPMGLARRRATTRTRGTARAMRLRLEHAGDVLRAGSDDAHVRGVELRERTHAGGRERGGHPEDDALRLPRRRVAATAAARLTSSSAARPPALMGSTARAALRRSVAIQNAARAAHPGRPRREAERLAATERAMENRRIALPSLRAGLAVAALCWAGIGQGSEGERCRAGLDPADFTVYAFSQSNVNEPADPQVTALRPDVNIRAVQKWSIWGDEAADYDFTSVARYHEAGIGFIGGGSASVIFRQDFGSDEQFDALSTRDADGVPVPHDYIVAGARRGSFFNPAFRRYIVDWCKLQIDGGVDGLFLDEITGGHDGGVAHNWNGNEGFDDFALADFNRYLLAKYPGFTAQDWKAAFDMSDDNLVRRDVPPDDLARNFDYRRYLQAHGWHGVTAEDSPRTPANPLAAEWGSVTANRMYADDVSFTGTYLRRYWKEMVAELRAYAARSGRRVLITSNGVFPDVDFNSVGMYPWNPDEQTPDYRGADYVPVVDGHLNGAKSLMGNYRYLRELGRRVSGDVPLVVFIDWPNDMMSNYLNLPLAEKQDFWRIFGAEAYATGIFPAFHLKDTVGSPTASDQGMLKFFEEHTRFYKQHRSLYRGVTESANAVRVGASGVAANVMSQRGGRVHLVHLVNHNYQQAIVPQGPFLVEVELASRPRQVTLVSPDLPGPRRLAHAFRDGRLIVKVDGLRYYDVLVVE